MERLLQLCSSEEDFDLLEIKKFLLDHSLANVDVSDEHGMTALMHCAYRGHLDACRELLTRGADVNNNGQKDGYTALMFAAIAGQRQVVEYLLRAGAIPSTVNNLGKTASNMAAFVGQHKSAQSILNFLSIHELDEFIKVDKGLPRLSPSLATPLHSLLVTTELHPVLVMLELQKEPALVDSSSAVLPVLKFLGKRLMNDHREGMTLKLHYLSFLIQLSKDLTGDAIITRMLTFSEAGKPVEMDLLLRQCLREFPHPHLPLIKQIITSLAKTTPGENPSAYTLFISVILGDKGAMETTEGCFTCGRQGEESLKKCSRCKMVWYCSVQCQQLAWTKGNHKKLCKLWTA